MLKYRRLLQGAIAFLTAVLVIACNAPSPPTDAGNNNGNLAEIPLGVAVAQTSNVALFGQEQILGTQIAETYFNENGGINGKPLKIILQDVAADEQGAINAFNTLINQDKVVGIVGPTLSQQAFAADRSPTVLKFPSLALPIPPKGFRRLVHLLAEFLPLSRWLLPMPWPKPSSSTQNYSALRFSSPKMMPLVNQRQKPSRQLCKILAWN